MNAKDLMSHPARTCHVNDSLKLAAQRMWDLDCGALAVVHDDGTIAGMITDRDVCMAALHQGRGLEDLLVNGAMSTQVVTVTPDETLGHVEQLMARHQVRRIPVIDANKLPIGMISLNDLAIESVKPDSHIRHGISKIAHTLAAICRPRTSKQEAA
jgi:CBS domain-containing protein